MSFANVQTTVFSYLFIISALTQPMFSAFAQDYPYDEVELKEEKQNELPVEKPDFQKTDENGRRRFRKLHSLFRVGIKFGGNFSYTQSPSVNDPDATIETSGFGFEALVAMGWDLPYQPLFIELESGYKSMFLTSGYPLHSVPLALGVYLRKRIGRRSLWKPGIKASLDVRIQDITDESTGEKASEFGVYPSFGVGSIIELGSFLVEPLFIVNRLQSQRSFFGASLRVGYRF